MSDVVIIRTRRGKDGRDYPVPMPPPRRWRWQVITLLHQLVHEQGMSERQAQAKLLARGYRRSAGTIHYDLSRPMVTTCARCRADAAATPPPPEPEPIVPQPSPPAAPRTAAGAGWAGPAPLW